MQFATENRNDLKTRNQHFFFAMFFLFVFAVLHFQKFGEVIRFQDLAPWIVQLFIVKNSSIPCEYSLWTDTTQFIGDDRSTPFSVLNIYQTNANKVYENRLSIVIIRWWRKKINRLQYDFMSKKRKKKSMWFQVEKSQRVKLWIHVYITKYPRLLTLSAKIYLSERHMEPKCSQLG